ncbi:MAG: hypothetical protein SOY12_09450 [Schaedlerella sp.]|nr:hypothetical protein [Lachnospiraceae bacterium]MDY4203239.1 hypothetical protein [Schaedlerella sp.]
MKKKVKKGTPGYLNYKLKAEIIRAILYFAIIAAVFLLGYSQTHSKENLLTVVAVVGCLPACKVLVGIVTRLPYRSIDPEKAEDIRQKTEHLTVIYDLVVTSSEKIMPVECIVISGDKIFGYVPSEKVDPDYAASHIKSILAKNGFKGVSIKLFRQYTAFMARAEGLNNIAAIEKDDTAEHEQKIAHLIQNISL